ncbi:hypothetical protein HAX54_035511 [Datura stramonium]|uniref:Uncharacterized protein n=1 Tax=Datura stramonium TaxID=4076 RepID=A0ABS8SFM6_DATST|nr:hypothetical protein [Datura stramonium]
MSIVTISSISYRYSILEKYLYGDQGRIYSVWDVGSRAATRGSGKGRSGLRLRPGPTEWHLPDAEHQLLLKTVRELLRLIHQQFMRMSQLQQYRQGQLIHYYANAAGDFGLDYEILREYSTGWDFTCDSYGSSRGGFGDQIELGFEI